MASICKDPGGRKRILFVAPDGSRKAIRLGKCSLRYAQEVQVRVEDLVMAATANLSPSRETAEWLAGISDDMAAKLAVVGLTNPRKTVGTETLSKFLDGYRDKRTDAAPRTILTMKGDSDRMTAFFGADRQLKDITPGMADEWVIWMRERGKDCSPRYAEATVGRTLKRARQFFRAAERSGLVTSNPFAGIKGASEVNESRKSFVSRETIAEVLAACPDAEWRLIVALSRYGGLRCPSEHLALTWPDVDWARNRFLVDSPKTGPRWVPIFPELRQYLEEAFELAAEGSLHIITSKRDVRQNLRTRFTKIIRRAGVQPWPRLFHNLRASRETELAAEYPLHVVTVWLGHSALIAAKHYLQVTDADFERAATGGAKSGALAAHFQAQQPAAPSRMALQETAQVPLSVGVSEMVRDGATGCNTVKYPRQESNL